MTATTSTAPPRYAHVRFISAGAGSGKTYRLTEELERALVADGVDPGRVIGTTFTVKAAAELRERVRERLIGGGRTDLAEQAAEALIGTVHSVCERLLKRFAFELGLSPELAVASIEDGIGLFDQALDEALTAADVRAMNALAARLDIDSWRRDVKDVADRARDNDVAPDALAEMGRRSADELLGFFPPPQTGDVDGPLLERVRAALAALDAGGDTTAGTAKYHALLRRAIYQLRRPPAPWPLWMSLASGKATKASEPIAASVREAAADFAAHPRFQADIRRYTEQVYAIAAGALGRFGAIKRQRGLIDFTDMEQQLLHALDTPVIRRRMTAELDLLLVDEFQDTNPMQLAIFMKLAELADKVIFVGDVKQAIYAFRGCDPDLVFELLAELAAQGGGADVLEHSWRSRPALVDYVNAVFGEAFAGTLDPAEVALEAKRRERTAEPAVLRWTLAGRSGRAQAQSLARAARELVESGYEVVDRASDAPRPVGWGDIAVLAASNDHVEEIARSLRAARVPMKMTLNGLLTVPEICLARACLRRLSDAGDTLATAEIVAMSDCGEPEAWLVDRLRWLEQGGESRAWAGASHPLVAKLEALRAGTGTQSPVEIVARVLNAIGLREVVTAWGPDAIRAAQRQRNLDALLNLAVEYERHCEAQHFAATLTGLLFWLEHPHSPELDLQPVVTTGDAVHVLTYHRAKGLEWPVVIAADLHYRWHPRLWDVRAEGVGAGFNLRRPLANRVIRFWPPLFGRRKGFPVLDAIIASDEAQLCIAKGRDESRRLAYVGLSRARDALVLAVPSSQVKEDMWLSALQSDKVLPDGGRLTLPGGRSISTRAVTLEGGGDRAAAAPFEPRRLPERAPLARPRRARVNPSEAAPLINAVASETVILGARIALGGDDMTAIGTALHAAIAAELINPDRADALERTRALLRGHGVENGVAATDALAAARRLRAWLEQRFAPRRIWAEYPIAHARADGHAVHGWIDVFSETGSGCVVVDHKSSPRPRSEWAGEACEHSGQLELYRAALEAAGKRVHTCWIHFPVGGGLVRVDFD